MQISHSINSPDNYGSELGVILYCGFKISSPDLQTILAKNNCIYGMHVMLWATANNQLAINSKDGKMPSLESRPESIKS